ncbi:uncharacterized protein LOC115451760 [Manduca sexta]|uniref:Uncharacterized protein n=1 Tax=Manduca sexta TaxID=7130 RepID=A0A921ZRA4_MANSE|nr:uncharacterized protein LOC115451760 [Manduca sexta]KAG6462571.1 hypothetical protein O3G_MSEX013342 [Manduca sexta]
MEKNKPKKTKTLQIKYPIPYTQSWPNAERAPKHKKNTLRSAQKKPLPPLQQRCRPCAPPRIKAPDPTVPHLKYGIFPKKTSLARGQSKTVTSKPTKQPSAVLENENIKTEKKKSSRNAPSAEPPLFVFRAIDKTSTRQLSMSETMHIDVKPRRNLPMSPMQRNISPTARVRRT